MERKLSFILLIMLLIFGCKGKPETQTHASQEDQVVYEEAIEPQEPESADFTPQKSPLSKYEYNWSGSDDMPDIVIIVDDFGNSGGKLLEDFADLPQEIVFAVLPDLSHSKTAAEIAARKGHEVIIHVPMEAENSSVSPARNSSPKTWKKMQYKMSWTILLPRCDGDSGKQPHGKCRYGVAIHDEPCNRPPKSEGSLLYR
jgi:hypothetical protein